MISALALPIVASIIRVASINADLGVRAEGRSTTIAAPELPDQTRGSFYTTPRATVTADAWRLRLVGTYAPRVWTSDVAMQPSPFVNHAADVRLHTTREGTWRADLTASAVRGTTDPLADPWQADALRREQVGTTGAFDFEDFTAGALTEWNIGRTTVAAAGGVHHSRATGPDTLGFLPPQRTTSVEGSITRFATENNTFRLDARAARTVTDSFEGETRSETSMGFATWRRRTSLHLDFWVAGGATLASFDGDAYTTISDVLPMAEVGFARGGSDILVTGDLTVRLTTAIDRFNGEVSSMAEAACSVAWRPAPRLSIAASVAGGARPDGDTALGRTSVRVQWMLRELVALEMGATGSLQRESRPELPSFVEGAVLANVVWTVRERLTLDLGFMGRVHNEQRAEARSFVEGAIFAGVGYGTGALFGSARRARGQAAGGEAGAGEASPHGG